MLHLTLGRGPGRVRLPPARRAGRRLRQHLVNLLEGEALRLGDEEVCEEGGEDGGRAPDEEHLRPEVELVGGDEVGRDDADDAVPEPVSDK